MAHERGRYGSLQDEHAARTAFENDQAEQAATKLKQEQNAQKHSGDEKTAEVKSTQPKNQSPGWDWQPGMEAQQASANRWAAEATRRQQEKFAEQSSAQSDGANTRRAMIEKAQSRMPAEPTVEQSSTQRKAQDDTRSDTREVSDTRRAIVEQARTRNPSEDTPEPSQSETHTRGRGR